MKSINTVMNLGFICILAVSIFFIKTQNCIAMPMHPNKLPLVAPQQPINHTISPTNTLGAAQTSPKVLPHNNPTFNQMPINILAPLPNSPQKPSNHVIHNPPNTNNSLPIHNKNTPLLQQQPHTRAHATNTPIINAHAPQEKKISNGQPTTLNQGPHTTNLTEEKIGSNGNWVKKNNWLVRSYDANNRIQTTAVDVQVMRKTFADRYMVINDELNIFYKTVGIEQGKISEMLANVTEFLTKKQTKSLTSIENNTNFSTHEQKRKIEAITESIQEEKNSLEQLTLDIQSIEELDKSLTDRLKKMHESIASSNVLALKAEENIKQLWDIIDDKKARIIYYELENSTLEKIKNILVYLQTALLPDFEKTIKLTHDQIIKTQTNIQNLEEKGLIIKNRAERINELRLQKLQSAQSTQDNINQETRENIDTENTATPWYYKIYKFLCRILDSIKRIFYSNEQRIKPEHPTKSKMSPNLPEAEEPSQLEDITSS